MPFSSTSKLGAELGSKLVVLDMDDTIYLERDYVRSGFTAVSDVVTDATGILGFFNEAWALFESGTRGKIFNQVLQKLEINEDKFSVSDCVKIYRNHRPDIELLPDARAFLNQITRVTKTGLITDGPASSQRNKIKALGLEDFVTDLIVTDEYEPKWTKPSPQAFIHFMQANKISPSECIYIGDNPTKDFQAPLSLGWHALRVRRPQGLHYLVQDSDISIESVSTLDKHEIIEIDFFQDIL